MKVQIEALKKEDWQKIKEEAYEMYRQALISMAVFGNTWKNAEERLKDFPDEKK